MQQTIAITSEQKELDMSNKKEDVTLRVNPSYGKTRSEVQLKVNPSYGVFKSQADCAVESNYEEITL